MYEQRIGVKIREALDEIGVELTWRQIMHAAERVSADLYEVFEDSAKYEDMANS